MAMTVVDGGSRGSGETPVADHAGETHHDSLGDRLVGGMPAVLVLVLFGFVAARAARPVNDPDDWWHLRLGNDLIAQHSLSTPDHWSSFASLAWVPTEPLPEVASAYVERWLGLPGLAVLFAAVLAGFVLTVQVTHRRHAVLLPASVATVLTVLAAAPSLTARPQLLSFVLLPVVLAAWLQTERDLKARWWLVPLSWFWSLCHGFWIFGVGVGVLFVAGIALSRRADLRSVARLAGVAVASLAVVALNPVGLGVLEAPFAVHSTSQYVSEWQRTDLLHPGPLGAEVMIVVTAVVWIATRQRVTWSRVLLLATAVFLVWYAARLVVVGALLTGPLFAGALDVLVARGRAGGTGIDPAAGARWIRRSEVLVGVAGALASLAYVAVLAPHTADQPGDVPVGLDSRLDRLPAGTPVFNSYTLGGWLTWRHPDLEQYIDGLITPYSISHVRDYARAEATRPGWYRVVLDSEAPVALLATGSGLARALARKGWTSGGTSAGYVLLQRPT
jgi:hypothetical protein